MKKTDKRTVSDKKREAILNATRELVAKYGFAKTTLDDISSAIGMKKSSLYYYYPSRDDIIFDVMKTEIENYLTEVEEEVKKVKGCINKIITFYRTNLHYLQRAVNPYNVSINVFFEIKHSIRSIYKELLQREITFLTQIIKDGIKMLELKNCDAKRLATSIVTILESLKYQEFYVSNAILVSDVNFEKVDKDFEYILKLLFDSLTK